MTEYVDHPWRAWNRPSGYYTVLFPHKTSPQTVGFWSVAFRDWQIAYQGFVPEDRIKQIGPRVDYGGRVVPVALVELKPEEVK